MHLTQKLGEIAAAAEKMPECGDNSAIGDFDQRISSLGLGTVLYEVDTSATYFDLMICCGS